MKKQILIAAAVLLGATAANATCWRINPSPYAKAQFKTVEEAMNDINVLAGDTLLMDPGNHGAIYVQRKNMTIIGTGYFLDQNTDWSETMVSTAASINLSEGSKVEGMLVTGVIRPSATSYNCVVSRCKVGEIYAYDTKNWLIEECFVTSYIAYPREAIVRNNIVFGYISAGEGTLIENNVVVSGTTGNILINTTNATIRNNIVINTMPGFDNNNRPWASQLLINFDTSKNNSIQNNVLSAPATYADPNYVNNFFVGATVENTFVNTGSEDGKYHLLDNSPAKGKATHGGDCGAFGGSTPYVLSGIPQFLPHITEALVPAKPTDGKITVKLKIANQNE